MSQLATACGISKANIYHYYNSKDALLFGILDTYLKSLRDHICNFDTGTLAPDEALRVIVSETLLAYQGADYEHKIQIKDFGKLPEDQQIILQEYQRDLVKHLSDIMKAVAPKIFETEPAKLRAATMSVYGMMNWFYMWNSNKGPKAREEYAKIVSTLTLSGVHGL